MNDSIDETLLVAVGAGLVPPNTARAIVAAVQFAADNPASFEEFYGAEILRAVEVLDGR